MSNKPRPAAIIHAVGSKVLLVRLDPYRPLCEILKPDTTSATSVMVSHVCDEHDVKVVWRFNED